MSKRRSSHILLGVIVVSKDVKNVYNDSSLKISKIIERKYSNSLTEEVFRTIATTCGLDHRQSLILDIGCGNANAAIWFAKNYGAKITGIDLSPTMIAQANLNIESSGLENDIRVIEGDFRSASMQNGHDVVFAIDVAMYFEDKRELYGKLASLVRPGGWVVTTDYVGKGARADLLGELLSKWALATPPSFDQLSHAILSEGLEINTLKDSSPWQIAHWEDVKKRVLDHQEEILKAVGQQSFDVYLQSASMIIKALKENAHGYVFCIAKKRF